MHKRSFQCSSVAGGYVYSPNDFFQQKGSGKPSGVIPVCRGFSAAAKLRAVEPGLFHRDLWHCSSDVAIYHQPLSSLICGPSYDNTEHCCSFTDLVPG